MWSETADKPCVDRAFGAWDFGDGYEEDGVGGIDAIVGKSLGKASEFVGGGVEPNIASSGISQEVAVFHGSAGVGMCNGGGVLDSRTQVVAWFTGRTRTGGVLGGESGGRGRKL